MGNLYLQTIENIGEELQNYVDQNHNSLTFFGPVNRINIFVGTTNSGKSRFMRGLAKGTEHVGVEQPTEAPGPQEVMDICNQLASINFVCVMKLFGQKFDGDKDKLKGYPTEFVEWLVNQRKERDFRLTNRDFNNIRDRIKQILRNFEEGKHRDIYQQELVKMVELYQFVIAEFDNSGIDRSLISVEERSGFTENVIEWIEKVSKYVDDVVKQSKPSRIVPKEIVYIPVLRTAVFLDEISDGLLANSISKNYRLDKDQGHIQVFTGTSLYSLILSDSRSEEHDVLERLRQFKRFLGETFFEGKTIDLVLSDKENEKHIVLNIVHQGRGATRRFHDIGDGIQAIIILMYKLFTVESGSWVFIEEPEQGLHPGLQRIFLETISNYPVLADKDIKVFFTTHSNHLLGMALTEIEDVSVFSLQRWENPEQFEVRSIHHRQESLLKMLGVDNSSVFLANCGIWVEGITDRMYVKAYLKAFLDSVEFDPEKYFEPREDVHYGFFEYAGSNLVHYLFGTENNDVSIHTEAIRAQFLNNRIFLLADRDEGKEEKHKNLGATQNDCFQYEITSGVEIENMISGEQLTNAIPQLIPSFNVDDIDRTVFNIDEYRYRRIGIYIKEKLGENCSESLVLDSGSLSPYYKTKLANIVCDSVNWGNMSDDARELTKSVFAFICKHNQQVNSVAE